MFGQQADIFSLCLSSCPHEDDLNRIQPIPETEKVDTERLLFIFQNLFGGQQLFLYYRYGTDKPGQAQENTFMSLCLILPS
jgi:hypothetical protein